MNDILQLKGRFRSKAFTGRKGPNSLPSGTSVDESHLSELKEQLERILAYWKKDTTIGGALVSVYYYHIVAKSNRIAGFLSKGRINSCDSICGSKFSGPNLEQHVFTHFIDLEILEYSIQMVTIAIQIVKKQFKGVISFADITRLNKKETNFNGGILPRSKFVDLIVDTYYVEKFMIDRDVGSVSETSIVSIYKTGVKTTDLLSKLGINMIEPKTIDDETVLLTPDELEVLKVKAPYLIAMKTSDFSKVPEEPTLRCDPRVVQIPAPTDEPVIGVIDTLFYKDVYFGEWVTYYPMLDDNIPKEQIDYVHGTEVSSLIVDGPNINPELEDGCGRFRVKHFGVTKAGRFSSFTILKAIREIITQNKDIKVWNLSLGSTMEINKIFISPEGAELDRIQCEFDVIFIVAGTNRQNGDPEPMLLGSPADSLNSIVVNSVNHNNEPASYHREGPVLSFFIKPDISCFGGDRGDFMRVCGPTGLGLVTGTSFAAPWIARKMAFLIHTMGLNREVAKALLIDAATGWNGSVSKSIGYGIVPKRIEEIVQSSNDEIRFILTGTTDAYETYTHEIPVPIQNGKQPFFARATLVYFPKCYRSQGVDYTSTEMDIHFGRVHEKDGKTDIKSLDTNQQGDVGRIYLPEENARKTYRKWDNVKHIRDVIKTKSVPRTLMGTGLWGLNIRLKERLPIKNGRGLTYGIVITLKEMNGINRIDDFIKLCMFRGWIVNAIDISSRIDVYQKAEEDIEFDIDSKKY